jgi:hypothetical protein
MQGRRVTHGRQCLSIRRLYRFCRQRALTFFTLGRRNDFVMRWWSAFAIGWPIAAGTACLAIPFARSLTSASSPPSKGPEQPVA